ncbi:MAG: D-alanine--D-alanine ligase [Henriciella sp.]|jgi:D-alanine-D-alanine ligase|nr:D-alanine--D-alanine ligase [Henriciella sp.]
MRWQNAMKTRTSNIQSPAPKSGGIEIVTTETAGMRESGFGSVETCRGIADVLGREHSGVRFNLVTSKSDLREIVDRRPDLVILCVKYIFDDLGGEVIWLSDFFDRNELLHSGSAFKTLEFDSNKSIAKTFLRNKGVATAEFFLARPEQFSVDEELPLDYPLFVKPLDAANGNGIDDDSIVRDFASFEAKTRSVVDNFGRVALVERVLTGREFTVAILGEGSNQSPHAIPVEIIAQPNKHGDRILGAEAKTANREVLQAVHGELRSRVAEFALRAFGALGGRDFGRIDIKMDARGVPHFLEANLVPGMTRDSSYFPEACRIDAGLSYRDVVLKILDLTLQRKAVPATV